MESLVSSWEKGRRSKMPSRKKDVGEQSGSTQSANSCSIEGRSGAGDWIDEVEERVNLALMTRPGDQVRASTVCRCDNRVEDRSKKHEG